MQLKINDIYYEFSGINEKQALELYGFDSDVEYEVAFSNWKEVRKERNALLKDSDWTQMSDTALTAAQVSEWVSYRQTLRDITEAYSDPVEVVLPDKPDT